MPSSVCLLLQLALPPTLQQHPGRSNTGCHSAISQVDRANLTALKGNDAAQRFVEELNSVEDQLQAARKQVADLEQQKNAAVDKLNAMIATLSFDWDVK
jgi:hypothetical protein